MLKTGAAVGDGGAVAGHGVGALLAARLPPSFVDKNHVFVLIIRRKALDVYRPIANRRYPRGNRETLLTELRRDLKLKPSNALLYGVIVANRSVETVAAAALRSVNAIAFAHVRARLALAI